MMLAQAENADLEAVVDLFARSRQVCLPFLPVLHSREEDLDFFGGYIQRGQMTLARVDGAVAGFLAQTPGWIEHLYLDPALRRRGIGQALMAHAKMEADQLDLWCFAENHAARAFYAAQGFAEIGGTQGDNEAGLPDILLRWQAGAAL
ncbi:MAG TPA: GNAT family N-acetyltransferase [Devosia sp.]|jgi:GNAT superfamily N-acetyltransferase|uniref:GNAT family N-acetyltransferase n=1 Tax=Devosia sp. TaxID=1871048 RepID=UPI002F9460B6